MKCKRCTQTAEVDLPWRHTAFCRDCWPDYFLGQIEKAAKRREMFAPGDKILVALSGGKDSLALAHALKQLGRDVSGVYVDLGIPEASAQARAKVQAFTQQFDIPLSIVDLAAEGLSIPELKAGIDRPVCSLCGRVKREAFNRAAVQGGFDVLATGHVLHDEAARLFANLLRWDDDQLARQSPSLPARPGFVKKVKPLYRLTDYETACWCFFNTIDHHQGPCPLGKGAGFSDLKSLFDSLDVAQPGRTLEFYEGFLDRGRPFFTPNTTHTESPTPCPDCGGPAFAEVCSVCRLKRCLEKVRLHGPAAKTWLKPKRSRRRS